MIIIKYNLNYNTHVYLINDTIIILKYVRVCKVVGPSEGLGEKTCLKLL